MELGEVEGDVLKCLRLDIPLRRPVEWRRRPRATPELGDMSVGASASPGA